MSDLVWTFERNGQRLEVSRADSDDGPRLMIAQDGTVRSYEFHDLAALVNFQSDMEAMLVQTGWSFVEFAPDRRAGRDRRGWPRRPNDRRRWWTDGAKLAVPKPSTRRRR